MPEEALVVLPGSADRRWVIKRRYCQMLWIAPDHATTFSLSFPSTNSPFTNLAPALTSVTR